ncbi:6-phosphogluconolactonase [Nocardioides jiangxiensis]|uniref:6-phosphogluconolactonase n=1 Tax=Nocardioides jiangxiensis TaxID=3064524 RepID=A0ABT9B8T9_9ACTN|nr:6-phosphogluconolactonase [Nocardioides sp. WY-20]MDO7869568.1 6-phosphogluconolactonase [Nocardioides sp. WY-20]
MTISVEVSPDAARLTETVAAALTERLAAIQAEGRTPRVVLAGGSIIEELHRVVAAAPGDVDWSRVEFWWGDERYVDSWSPDRNCLAAQRDLLTPLGASPDLVHVPPATDSGQPVQDAAATYAQDFPAGDFDVVMLGMGPDGHTCSLFPGREDDVLSTLDAVAVVDSPKPPALRLSMTPARLSRSSLVWLVASGTGKAEAVRAALAPTGGSVDPVEVPAVAPRGAEATIWWLDEDAAALL